ncbi:MAG: type I glutamate--ammonia ligase [archaeon]
MKGTEVIERAKKDKVKFLELIFTDIHGMIKSVTIPADKIDEALDKGIWFDGSSIEGFTRICESDMYLMPDPKTYAVIPWKSKECVFARMICDVYMPSGKPFEGDPRYILKKVIAEAKELGFEYFVGPELEFFLFKRNENGELLTLPHDIARYFDYAPRDLASDVRRDIALALESFGIVVEMSHHEVAQGQHEIDFKYSDALTTADNAITFKYVVKSIAHVYGLHASFMPKPIFGENGSGMHVHQSMFGVKSGKNEFFDDNDKYKLSAVAKHFIAGQLDHVTGMSAILSPTVNSYKRLVPGYEAPVYICWGQTNRSALIRIPRYSKGREQSTRAELRCPDPSCNPYMAFAVMLKAGLDGIKRKLELGNPVEENVYKFDDETRVSKNIKTLPPTLFAAISEMQKDEVVAEALGKHLYPIYVRSKLAEWDEYRLQVTKWEIDKYFERT